MKFKAEEHTLWNEKQDWLQSDRNNNFFSEPSKKENHLNRSEASTRWFLKKWEENELIQSEYAPMVHTKWIKYAIELENEYFNKIYMAQNAAHSKHKTKIYFKTFWYVMNSTLRR